MPLTQPQRIALARMLGHLRDDWHSAGIHSAVVKLADDLRSPFVLSRQAIDRAGNAAARTPECITFATPPNASDIDLVTDDQRVVATWSECPEHGSTVIHADGRFICCRFKSDPQPYTRAGVKPPPADFAERVRDAQANVQRPEPPTGAGIGSHDRIPPLNVTRPEQPVEPDDPSEKATEVDL